MSSAVESSTAPAEAVEVEEDRWPDLPNVALYRPDAAPMMASQVITTSPHLRRAAIAQTTDMGVLDRIIRTELRNEYPRREVIAMCNQQKNRVETMGLAEGDDADE